MEQQKLEARLGSTLFDVCNARSLQKLAPGGVTLSLRERDSSPAKPQVTTTNTGKIKITEQEKEEKNSRGLQRC